MRSLSVAAPLETVQTAIGNVFRGMRGLLEVSAVEPARQRAGTLVGAPPVPRSPRRMSYAMSKNFEEAEKFGTGHIEGIVEWGRQQQRAGRRLDSGHGVIGVLDHGHRDRRPLHEEPEPGPHALRDQCRQRLRRLPAVHRGQPADAAVRLGRDQELQAGAAPAAQGAAALHLVFAFSARSQSTIPSSASP